MKIFAETERLFLREIVEEDIDGLLELDSDPEIHRYLPSQPVQEKEQIKDVIKFVRQQYLDNGIGRWAIMEKSTKNFIGWAGLKLINEPINHHVNYYDLGYRIIRKYWGQGFATESAIGSLRYGFEKLKVNEIYAMANTENHGSNHVLTKVGFEFIENFDLDRVSHNWYKLSSEDWTKRKPNPNKLLK